MIKKFITSTILIDNSDINIDETYNDLIDNNNKLKVISYMGTQSKGKSTGSNTMFGLESETGTDRTTEFCSINIVIKKNIQYAILDAPGYSSPETELEYLELLQDNPNKHELAQDLNKKMSIKLNTFLWTISDVVIYFLDSTELQSSCMFDFLNNLQKKKYIKYAADPFVYFVCINSSNGKLNDTIIYNRLKLLIGKYDIIKDHDIIIVPYYNNPIDEMRYENQMTKLFNNIVNLPNKLSANVKYWKESIKIILDNINKDEDLLSITERELLWCQKNCDKLVNNFNMMLNNNKQYKILDTEIIIEQLLNKFNKKSLGVNKELYKNKLYENLHKSAKEYKQFMINKINVYYNDTIKVSLQNTYYQNIPSVFDINEHQRRLLSCEQQLTQFKNNVSLEYTTVNINEYIIIFNDIFITKYKECHNMCNKNIHKCTVGGNHTTHIYSINNMQIYCPFNCGYSKYVSCNDNTPFVCPPIYKYCPLNCGSFNVIKCNEQMICPKRTKHCPLSCGYAEVLKCDENLICKKTKEICCEGGCGKTKIVPYHDNTIYSCGIKTIMHCGWCKNEMGLGGCVKTNGICSREKVIKCYECYQDLVVKCNVSAAKHIHGCMKSGMPSECLVCGNKVEKWRNLKEKIYGEPFTTIHPNWKGPFTRFDHIGCHCTSLLNTSGIKHWQCCGQNVGTKGCTKIIYYC